MNTQTAQIKNDLHRLIVETDDISVLSKVQAYFDTLRSKNIDWWDMISDNEKKAIQIGLDELEQDKKVPHEEVRQKVYALLNKKNA